ncbi:hypothetical protein NCAS_0A04380 [Naumovozyma castellii]|uniref:SPRY domain-containing protein n=1 Tax=Naumovozyma castellii TaxID=27288 RepID=G0V6A4_NAUCA|nr:hypothetical protein NCAS_0A04380 [Naumovozyma castellii CBS 4309]CCC66996.1 hypothetical protein NCAS_0A04380 [Naumovozyma castellii CBS 4309]
MTIIDFNLYDKLLNTGRDDNRYMIPDPPTIPQPPVDSDPETVSLAFLISLSVTFAILMLLLMVMAAYITFCGADEAEYDEESGQRPRGPPRFNILFSKRHDGILLDSSFTSPGQFDDECEHQEREHTELNRMSPFELELYKRSNEFQEVAPPHIDEFGTYLKATDLQVIKDRGIQSYFLLPSINDNVNKQGNFLPSFLIQDKLDMVFTKYNKSSSTVMNYPLPYTKRDAVYFEVKVFKHQPVSNTIFSIGLVTVPYPYFRIPGMAKFSIAYESTGKLRINNPFMASTLLPKLVEGDVVGFGYRYSSGTIFITHNGKKLMDVTQNVGVDLFVGLGAFNASYTRSYTKDGLLEDPDNIELREALSEGREIVLPDELQRVRDPHNENDQIDSEEVELHVNLGQVGFVFIEANVKKYAFGTVYGNIGIPPSYNGEEIKNDKLLQKGDELPPNYGTLLDSNGFFGDIHINEGHRNNEENANIIIGSSDTTLRQGAHNVLMRKTPETETYERISSRFDRENNLYDDNIPELAGLEERDINMEPSNIRKESQKPTKFSNNNRSHSKKKHKKRGKKGRGRK